VLEKDSLCSAPGEVALQHDRFKPLTASKTERWIVTIVARKDVQDLEVSDGMVRILRTSILRHDQLLDLR
jgi:hypothetical protein